MLFWARAKRVDLGGQEPASQASMGEYQACMGSTKHVEYQACKPGALSSRRALSSAPKLFFYEGHAGQVEP